MAWYWRYDMISFISIDLKISHHAHIICLRPYSAAHSRVGFLAVPPLESPLKNSLERLLIVYHTPSMDDYYLPQR